WLAYRASTARKLRRPLLSGAAGPFASATSRPSSSCSSTRCASSAWAAAPRCSGTSGPLGKG
ncbi:RRBP1, partial [Symbiodinium sp. KB8]